MKRILVSNDDGVSAPGLEAMVGALAPLAEVIVMAPLTEQSASSHALTLRHPLRVRTIAPGRMAVDGTPTDCVLLALKEFLPEPPHLVVSGINQGPNMGEDVIYSGTVAAAMEGALLGVPAIAVSLAAAPPHDFVQAARLAAELARALVASRPSRPVLLNLHVPPGLVRGWRLARLGKRTYGNEVVTKIDPRGRRYYWIGGEGGAVNHDIPGSDCNAVGEEGLASVTPLQLDATDGEALEALGSLRLPTHPREPGP